MRVDHTNDRLFKQLLGKKLHQVQKELGFPGIPPTVFRAEDILIFQQHMDKLATSHQTASSQLARALQKGTVLAIHTLEDGQTRVTVDFEQMGHRCTVQLLHNREQWRTTGTPSVYRMQRKRLVPLIIAGFIALLIVAGMGMASVFGDTATITLDEAINFVEEHGYVVMTPKQKNELVTAAEENGYAKARKDFDKQKRKSAAEANDNNHKKETDHKKKKEKKKVRKKELVFTMKEGMTSEELIQALKDAGLVDDAIAFGKKLQDSGIATKVRPGKYTFSSDMSVDEMIEQLQ